MIGLTSFTCFSQIFAPLSLDNLTEHENSALQFIEAREEVEISKVYLVNIENFDSAVYGSELSLSVGEEALSIEIDYIHLDGQIKFLTSTLNSTGNFWIAQNQDYYLGKLEFESNTYQIEGIGNSKVVFYEKTETIPENFCGSIEMEPQNNDRLC